MTTVIDIWTREVTSELLTPITEVVIEFLTSILTTVTELWSREVFTATTMVNRSKTGIQNSPTMSGIVHISTFGDINTGHSSFSFPYTGTHYHASSGYAANIMVNRNAVSNLASITEILDILLILIFRTILTPDLKLAIIIIR